MLRNFIETSIKIHIYDVQSFVTFRISVDFYFFSIAILRVSVEKIKKIETYSECYETVRIIYMYFYRGVCKVSIYFDFSTETRKIIIKSSKASDS